MKRLNNVGSGAPFLLLVVMSLLFLASTAFGIWAFASREDFKKNTDKKIEAAVEVAKKQTASEKDNEFVEKEKQPLKSYMAPEAYGSLSFSYPKTWSALVSETSEGNAPVDGYFYPNFIPGAPTTNSSKVAYALRALITATTYDTVAKTFNTAATAGKVKISPFAAEKVPSVVGLRVDGEVVQGKQGAMVIFPLRDKTIEVWTESAEFAQDFNKSILPTLSFIP